MHQLQPMVLQLIVLDNGELETALISDLPTFIFHELWSRYVRPLVCQLSCVGTAVCQFNDKIGVGYAVQKDLWLTLALFCCLQVELIRGGDELANCSGDRRVATGRLR